MDKHWTDFENVATFNYARTFVDRMYRDSSTLTIPSYVIEFCLFFFFIINIEFVILFKKKRFTETDELKLEIDSLRRQNNEMRNMIDKMEIQSNRVCFLNIVLYIYNEKDLFFF